jgi:hypothetical protein
MVRFAAGTEADVKRLLYQGPLARIAPNVLLTSDVELMRRIAAPRSQYRKSDWYMAFRFNPERDSVISHRDDAAIAQLRTKLSPGVGRICCS